MEFVYKKFSIQHLPFIIFLFAFLIRLLLIPHPGFEADVSFWKSWGLATYDKGIVEGMKVSNNNYPTPFAYTLGMMVKIYSMFADPHNFNEYWKNTNVLFLFVSKLPSILADFGIAGIILVIPGLTRNPSSSNTGSRLGGRDDKMQWLYPMLAAAYLLNPVSLIDGAWWGQVDSLGVFIFLIAFCLSLKRMPFWAGAVYMLGVMTKLQNMIYGPLFFLFIWQTMGYQGLVKSVAGSTLAFFGLNIEFLLARDMGRVINSLTQNFDYFPWMSLNAFNLWWIVAGAKGMQVSDKLLTFGITNAKTMGLLIFSSFYLFALLRMVMQASKTANNLTTVSVKAVFQRFIEGLILVNAAFFLFQTQSHDRYAFPLSVFLLLWAPFFVLKGLTLGRVRPSRITIFSLLYFLFTIVYFYNLHTALVLNYPNNGIPILSNLTHPFLTIVASIILLSLFVIYLVYLLRQTKRIVFFIAVAVLMTLLFTSNLPLILKKPMSLNLLTPYISEQGYGLTQKNMPINASLGFKSWSPLSVQYVFYRNGIGTHAPSRQAYHINGLFKRFTSDYGIDTEAGSQASAIFQIYGDDMLLFQSEKMGRYEYPKHTEVDLAGVKIMTLVTTDTGDGNTDDHTDWLNPQLFP